jgi:hypothetical protein
MHLAHHWTRVRAEYTCGLRGPIEVSGSSISCRPRVLCTCPRNNHVEKLRLQSRPTLALGPDDTDKSGSSYGRREVSEIELRDIVILWHSSISLANTAHSSGRIAYKSLGASNFSLFFPPG